MKNPIILTAAMTAICALSGCANTPMLGNAFAITGANTPKLRWMSLSDDAGTVYAWDTGSNIAYMNKSGKACILAASVAKKADVTLKIEDKTAGSIDLANKEALEKLQEKDKIATALDIGLFHYCILRNNEIKESEIVEFLPVLSELITNTYNKPAAK